MSKMKFAWIVPFCVVALACDTHRDDGEYSLDETSFDAEAMTKIQSESGITLPAGSVGLALQHIPPIDPIVFAKVRIPRDAEDSLHRQIEALETLSNGPTRFAHDRCAWWPPNLADVVATKHAFHNGWYLNLHLVNEDDSLVLYMQYFSI